MADEPFDSVFFSRTHKPLRVRIVADPAVRTEDRVALALEIAREEEPGVAALVAGTRVSTSVLMRVGERPPLPLRSGVRAVEMFPALEFATTEAAAEHAGGAVAGAIRNGGGASHILVLPVPGSERGGAHALRAYKAALVPVFRALNNSTRFARLRAVVLVDTTSAGVDVGQLAALVERDPGDSAMRALSANSALGRLRSEPAIVIADGGGIAKKKKKHRNKDRRSEKAGWGAFVAAMRK